MAFGRRAHLQPRIDRVAELSIPFRRHVRAVVHPQLLRRRAGVDGVGAHREAVDAVQVEVDGNEVDVLPLAPADPPPADLLTTAYDGLHQFGIEIVPSTRMCKTFRALIAALQTLRPCVIPTASRGAGPRPLVGDGVMVTLRFLVPSF